MKDSAKTRVGQHQPISSSSPIAVVLQELETDLPAHIFQGLFLWASSRGRGFPTRQGELGAVSGSMADEGRDLIRRTPSYCRHKD